VTGGSLVNSDGFPASITGGSLSIGFDGVISGFITLTGGGVVALSHGKLDSGKTMAAVVGVDSANFRFAGTVVKAVAPLQHRI
jgi:hypothetical protein